MHIVNLVSDSIISLSEFELTTLIFLGVVHKSSCRVVFLDDCSLVDGLRGKVVVPESV